MPSIADPYPRINVVCIVLKERLASLKFNIDLGGRGWVYTGGGG